MASEMEPVEATTALLREAASAEWHQRDVDAALVLDLLSVGADPCAAATKRREHRSTWQGQRVLWLVLANTWAGPGSREAARLLLAAGAELDEAEGELLVQRWAGSRGALRESWWALAEAWGFGALGARRFATRALLAELREARAFGRDADAGHVARCVTAGADPTVRLDADSGGGSMLGEVLGAALAGPGAARAAQQLLQAGAALSMEEAERLAHLWSGSGPHALEAWEAALAAGTEGQDEYDPPQWLGRALLGEALGAHMTGRGCDATVVQRALHAGADPCVSLGPLSAHKLAHGPRADNDHAVRLLRRHGAEGRAHASGHESSVAS